MSDPFHLDRVRLYAYLDGRSPAHSSLTTTGRAQKLQMPGEMLAV
jgi:hypothetical protein